VCSGVSSAVALVMAESAKQGHAFKRTREKISDRRVCFGAFMQASH
jgi:hypothetical protein